MKVKLPQSVIRGLKRGLELQRQGFAGKGLRDETVKMARTGVRTGQWEDWKIVKASAWFARHVADRRRMKDPSRWDKAPRYSPAYVAWALWGDDGKGAGRKWIDKKAKELKAQGVKASPRNNPSMPRVQYHATSWDRVPSILRKGLRLPRGTQDESTFVHELPSISTADSPQDALVYYPTGALLELRVKPGFKYLKRSARMMRRGESLIEAVNRWGREAIDKGAAGFYMEGWQSTVGNQTYNPDALEVVRVINSPKKRHNPPPGWSFNPISSAEAYSLRSRLGQAHVVKQARGWDWYVFEGDTFRQLDSGTTGSRRDAFAAATFAMERVDPVLTTAIDQEVKRAARIGGKQPVSKDFMDFYKAHARVNPPSSTASEIEDSLKLIEDFLRQAFMLLEEISGGEIYQSENTREGELNANTLFEEYVPMLNIVIENVMDVEDVVFRISKEFGGSDYKPQLRIVGRKRKNAHSDDTLGGVLDLAQDKRIGVVTRSFYYLDAARILIHNLFYPLGSNPNYRFFRRVQDEGRKIDLSYFRVILREIGEEVTRLQREYLEKYDAERRSQIRLIKNPARTYGTQLSAGNILYDATVIVEDGHFAIYIDKFGDTSYYTWAIYFTPKEPYGYYEDDGSFDMRTVGKGSTKTLTQAKREVEELMDLRLKSYKTHKWRSNPARTQPYKYGVPAKYLAGLPDKVARKRAAEIIRRRKSGAKTSEPLPGDKIARKKPMKGSKWTRMYKQKYGATAGTTKAKVARETGIPKSIIDEVYKRGVGASRSQGHRPGATDSSWALARVHAFVMKVLHKKGPINQDPDLARKVRSRR